jgi:class 3 adenylate cyclase
MSLPSFAELLAAAREFRQQAEDEADAVNLATFSYAEKHAAVHNHSESKSLLLIGDLPTYRELQRFEAKKAWGAMLCFDMRESTEWDEELGARGSHILLHTYLPVMLTIAEGLSGELVGMRGDGAILCFGRVEQDDGAPAVTEEQCKKAMYAVYDCGHAMVGAIQKVINPVLREAQIITSKTLDGRVKMGIGVDVGNFVCTRIGLPTAHDLTANGRPVNRCCKFAYGDDEVILSHRARDLFPKKKGGTTRFHPDSRKKGAFILQYPKTYKTLV